MGLPPRRSGPTYRQLMPCSGEGMVTNGIFTLILSAWRHPIVVSNHTPTRQPMQSHSLAGGFLDPDRLAKLTPIDQNHTEHSCRLFTPRCVWGSDRQSTVRNAINFKDYAPRPKTEGLCQHNERAVSPYQWTSQPWICGILASPQVWSWPPITCQR